MPYRRVVVDYKNSNQAGPSSLFLQVICGYSTIGVPTRRGQYRKLLSIERYYNDSGSSRQVQFLLERTVGP
jgi:hypothetical protein